MSFLWMSQRNANAGCSPPEIFKSSFAMFCRFGGGNYTHTHLCTHDEGMADENYRYISQHYKNVVFQFDNKLVFLFPFLCFSRSTFRCLTWVEGICNILLWDSESHQECIWRDGKRISFWLLNDKPSLCNEHVPGESILYALIEKVGQVGWLGVICVRFPDPSFYWYTLDSLFSCSVIDLQAVSHYCN